MEKPWYVRTMKNAAFPDKGPGEYWYDYKGFYFVREKSGTGLLIPADSLIDVRVGFWHGLTFSRTRILKLLWRNGNERLSSGFATKDADRQASAHDNRVGLKERGRDISSWISSLFAALPFFRRRRCPAFFVCDHSRKDGLRCISELTLGEQK